MKHLNKLFSLLVILFLSGRLFSQVPTITSFAPASGAVGTTVVLTGTNFSTVAANNIVYFGAAKATVTGTPTATSCTVIVPSGATYERISVEVGILTGYSKKPFIVTSNCPAPITTSSFDSTSFDSGNGNNPYYSALGDFDGDGKNDLALNLVAVTQLNFIRNTSTVGAISFVTDASKSTGGNPRGIATGDLNGDGSLDAVIYNNQGSNIGVLRNTSTLGAISFAAQVTYDVCSQTSVGEGVCIGDLDGDGKPEIVGANGIADSISILRNLNTTAGSAFTSASFATAVKIYVTAKPQFVYMADIDGDGKPDLVTANTSSDNIAVLRNTSTVGTISFAAPVYFSTGAGPLDFSIGDIDLDGKPEIVVPNNTGSSFSVFQNTSVSGTILLTRVDFATGANPRNTDISDINGDGKPDVVVLAAGPDDVEIFQNTSTSGVINASSLSAAIVYPLASASSPRQLSVGDLDGDGKPDLLSMSQVTDRVVTQRNLIWGGPSMTSTSSKTICSGSSVGLSLTAIPSSGTTYQWVAASNANITGESTTTQTGSTINNTLTNTTSVPQTVIYTVTPTSSTTCSGGTPQSQTVTITVNPKPAMTSATSASVCSGTALNFALTSNVASTYSWLTTDNVNTTGESTTAQSGSTINNTIINALTTSQSLIYTVTPTSTAGCVGNTQSVTVTVNPKPTMTGTTTATVCSGVALNIPLTSDITSTYSWLAANNANTTGESTTATSGSTINNNIVNSSTTAQSVIYTVTPTSTAGSCVGAAQTVTATVNAAPTMTNATSTSICTGIALSFSLTSNIGATYSWIASDNANTSGESTSVQTGGTINNTITNSTTAAQSVIYTVTPTSTLGSCVGTIQTVTVSVNPKPTMTSGTSASVCSGVAMSFALTSNIGATYSWKTTDNTNTTGESTLAQTGSTINNTITNNTTSAQSLTYSVTPTSTLGSCTGSTQSVTVTVNPKPSMTSATSASVCSGTALSFALTSNVASSYSWLAADNTNTSGESTTAQTSATINNNIVNNVTTAQSVVYSVTPTSSTGSCAGTAQTVTVTVNPKPVMTNAATTSVCSGTGMSFALTSGASATYSWLTSDNTNTTGESTTLQTGGTLDDIITNSLATAATLVYTVTPTGTAGNCAGAAQSVTVTVNPKPVMTSGTSTSVCSGTAMNFSLASGAAATYSWFASDNANTSGESTTPQTGSTINNTIINSLATATTLVYTVTPTGTAGSCVGTSQTVTVTVNPKPVMTSASSISVCSQTALSFALTSGAASTYSWLTSDNVNTTGESTSPQTGSTINNTINSTLTTTTTLVYTVTPTGTAGGCVGTSQNFTVTVNPKPVMTSATTASICSGVAMNFPLTSGASSTYTWLTADNANTTGESTAAQNSSTINNTITHTLTTAATLVYTVTPTGTVGACVGAAQTVTVTVNPKPTMTSANSKTICSGSPVNLALTSATPSTFQWVATDNANTTGESTSAQTGSTITNSVTSSSTSIQTVIYTVTPTTTTGSCLGTPQTVTVTLDNVPPVANAGTDISLCPFNINLGGNSPSPGTGVWTLQSQSTPTFTVTVYYPTVYNSLTNFNGIVTGDNATLRWTINSQLGVCPSTFDDVLVTKVSCPLTSAFTTSQNTACLKPGDSVAVVFTDNSVPGTFPPINSWTWTFNGGTPSSATGQGPHTVYYHYTATQTTYSATLKVVDNASNQDLSSQNITLKPKPSAPGIISGTSSVCQGATGVNYSVASITNANSYSWVFPNGVSSTNPNNIAVTDFSSSAESGVVKVAGVNTCGAGDTSYFAVTVNPLPGAAGAISGTTPVCQGINGVTYSVGAISNADTYVWTFPSGVSSSETTNSISVDFSTAAQSGLITVAGYNLCGTGTGSSFNVTMNPLPAAAGSITGTSPVCQGQNGVSYSINALTNATSYSWTFPSGGTPSGTTNNITADFSPLAVSGLVTVAGVNFCGNGASSTFSVTLNPLPGAAGSITGTSPVCAGNSAVSFSVPSIANVTGYNWTFPAGATSVNPNNIASTDFSTSAVSGMITVEGYNICGTGASSTFSVTVDPLPDAAGPVTGTTPVCQGTNGIAYSTAAIANATSYNWIFPSGITISGTSNSITADFGTAAQSGLITVTGVNACGTGTSTSFNVIVDPLPDAAGTISGSSTVCQGDNGVSFSVGGILNATTYNWTFPLGAASSDTTNVANVDFGGTSQSGLISVEGVNACGTGTGSTFSVTVNTLPFAAGSVSGTDTVCAGTSAVNYSIASILNAAGYDWTFPSGATSTNPNNIAATDFGTTAQSGIITVAGVNMCGTGPSATFSVTVNPLPEDASLITGADSVCQGQSGVSYFVNVIPNATTYIWSSPAGSSNNVAANNNSVDFSAAGQSGNITVYGQNACGNGNSSSVNVIVNPLPASPLFSGSAVVQGCPLPDSMLFSFSPAANALSYNWILPAGAFTNGSVNNDSIYVGFNSVGVSDSIKVASVNACGMSNYSSMLLTLQSALAPAICMVSVDSLSSYNEIFWDKTMYANSDTFLVYRDTANNNYALIGKVPYDSLSRFADTVRTLYAANGDPNVTSWRYKLAVQDSCGNISPMSPYHQTMFFQDNSGNFNWSPYEIEGQIIPVPALSNYLFERDDISMGVWNTIQTLSASSTLYTDPNYATYTSGSWRVKTQWSISCDPTRAFVNTSRSNIKHQLLSNGMENNLTDLFSVYPNPAKDQISVAFRAALKNCMVEIFDMSGRIVVQEKATAGENNLKINTENLANGIYTLRLRGENMNKLQEVRKLVIER